MGRESDVSKRWRKGVNYERRDSKKDKWKVYELEKNILSEMGERMRCVISAKVWESERGEWNKKEKYWNRKV